MRFLSLIIFMLLVIANICFARAFMFWYWSVIILMLHNREGEWTIPADDEIKQYRNRIRTMHKKLQLKQIAELQEEALEIMKKRKKGA